MAGTSSSKHSPLVITFCPLTPSFPHSLLNPPSPKHCYCTCFRHCFPPCRETSPATARRCVDCRPVWLQACGGFSSLGLFGRPQQRSSCHIFWVLFCVHGTEQFFFFFLCRALTLFGDQAPLFPPRRLFFSLRPAQNKTKTDLTIHTSSQGLSWRIVPVAILVNIVSFGVNLYCGGEGAIDWVLLIYSLLLT